LQSLPFLRSANILVLMGATADGKKELIAVAVTSFRGSLQIDMKG
jgi:hypothetical protein